MKNERGITMITLIITIILMMILAGVIIKYGTGSYDVVNYQNFQYELMQVQGKVDVIYEKIKLGTEEEKTNYITLGENITESNDAITTLYEITGIDYENVSQEDRENYYYQDIYTTYRYLSEDEVKETLSLSSSPGDLIINFQTREVISVYGFEYEDSSYYRLSDFSE